MLPFLVPLLWGAGLGAVVDGVMSALSADGDPEKAKREAVQRLLDAGFDESSAASMADGIVAEASTGDRLTAGAKGAVTGAITGAAGVGAGMGAMKGASLLRKAAKSFLSRGGKATAGEAASSGAALAVKPQVPTGPRRIRPSKEALERREGLPSDSDLMDEGAEALSPVGGRPPPTRPEALEADSLRAAGVTPAWTPPSGEMSAKARLELSALVNDLKSRGRLPRRSFLAESGG